MQPVSLFTSTGPREKGSRQWRRGSFSWGLTSKIHALVDAETLRHPVSDRRVSPRQRLRVY